MGFPYPNCRCQSCCYQREYDAAMNRSLLYGTGPMMLTDNPPWSAMTVAKLQAAMEASYGRAPWKFAGSYAEIAAASARYFDTPKYIGVNFAAEEKTMTQETPKNVAIEVLLTRLGNAKSCAVSTADYVKSYKKTLADYETKLAGYEKEVRELTAALKKLGYKEPKPAK